MRFLFIVQGEGRGHMTQAISLSSMLRSHGHAVVRVVVGRSARRTLPDFFINNIGAPVDQVDSPNFLTDKNSRSVQITKSVIHGLGKLGIYRRSIKELDEWVKQDEPDVIINFYDFIGGLYNRMKRPKAKFYVIAHQYLTKHPEFPFAKGRLLDKKSLIWGNWLTALKSEKRLALSFRPLSEKSGISIVPPLLRDEVKELIPRDDKFILVYMLNHGYASDIDAFHKENPEVRLECFWDNPDAPKLLKIDENLTYHQLDGKLFLEKMSTCSGYLTTAGFESICEAMFLGKPTLMMPVKGHYEQACNAQDAQISGAGLASESFDLQKLTEYIPKHKSNIDAFRAWCSQSESLLLKEITSSE